MHAHHRRALLLGATLAATTPLAGCVGMLNRLAPSGTYRRREGLAYGAGPQHRLDVYQPTAPAPAGGWPLVVFFYGGSWHWGHRSEYQFVGEALASRGVLTLVADYRLYPAGRYPDFLHDCAQATAYGLREARALGGNAQRAFVMGHSAGAYNAAMLALDARWLAAVGHSPAALAGWVGLSGPYDFLPITNPQARRVFHHPEVPPGTQPIDYVHGGTPPAFLGAARDDALVATERNTLAMARRLRAAGVPVTLKVYERIDHVMVVAAMAWSLRWVVTVLDDVAAFVTRDDTAARVRAA